MTDPNVQAEAAEFLRGRLAAWEPCVVGGGTRKTAGAYDAAVVELGAPGLRRGR